MVMAGAVVSVVAVAAVAVVTSEPASAVVQSCHLSTNDRAPHVRRRRDLLPRHPAMIDYMLTALERRWQRSNPHDHPTPRTANTYGTNKVSRDQLLPICSHAQQNPRR